MRTSDTEPPSLPPEAWGPLLRLARQARRPLERFLRIEAASGFLLLLAATVALIWANSPWVDAYAHLWHTPVGVRVGGFAFERSLEWVVNDGLMVIFFFVVGLEIRQEIHHGELSTWRRAALPAAAAIGGMVAPAALYLAIAGGAATRSGWGVPMATDIAFAMGILTLLGRRVPPALRVLLLALAVMDDLGAIAIIGVFYSSGVALSGLLVAAVALGGVLVMQRLGVRSKVAYIVPAIVVWAGVYSAGVHPTIAGVVVGLITPVHAWFGPGGFVVGVQKELEHLAAARSVPLSSHELARSLGHINAARREAMSPAESLIEVLHPWVAFGIMPIFALANAGVSVSAGGMGPSSRMVAIAATVGLVVGKPLGVLAMCWLTLRLGVATLPAGLTWRHLAVLGIVAGIGFTMALFIAQLAFEDVRLLSAAKVGVLVASGAAAVLGFGLGWLALPEVRQMRPISTAEETLEAKGVVS